MKSHAQRTKTITRTFRLDQKISETLEQEAEKEKITVNSLVSRILWNYQTSCQYGIHYNLMLVEPTIFKVLLDNMPEEALGKFGSSLGPLIVKENLARLGKSLDRESVEFILVETLGKWTKWYDADLTETNEGRIYYLHHALGNKWSIFLKNFLEKALATLLNINVAIDATDNSLIFTMPYTQPRKPL